MTNLMTRAYSMSVPSYLELTWYHSGLEKRDITNQHDTDREVCRISAGANDSYGT